jgi:hypothetical protein
MIYQTFFLTPQYERNMFKKMARSGGGITGLILRLIYIQSSRQERVIWPKISKTLFGPLHFSVFI